MEQFEQLLTCCVCLDRYRNPKLLPCQHSFCMEPCMEGLVDYVRRQVKCPECRAEHRIPYQGVQAFPTNVTLQRFLELHIEITGELPDPTSGQVMERCSVCSEKAYLSPCAHCDKKICEDCKSAHMDILRREITRINSQIRRSLHRLQDSLAVIEKNTLSLQTNCISVSEEIDEIYRRVTKAIKDRSEHLKGEIDRYLTTELRNLTSLKENLDSEINNIASNCDVADKYMNETVEWDDCELMDTKEIFLKTVEFLRNFEYENADYSRRVRFLVSIDPNQLVMNLATFGDLNITPHAQTNSTTSSSHLAPPSALQPGLMRSKSDHRLATQFRQQEERGGYDDEPALGGRKFGERRERYGETGSSRYGRTGGDYDYDYESEQSRPSKSRFRSRFVRSHQNDDSDTEPQRSVRPEKDVKDRDRVLDTEDVSRGQLSGIIRLCDCPRVIKRLNEQGKEKKEKKETPAAPPAPKPVVGRKTIPPVATRQISEEDEISRIKRQNKGATSTAAVAAAAAVTVVEPERPTADRVAALKRNTTSSNTTSATSEESDSSHRASPARRTPSRAEADSDSEEESDGSITSPQQSKPPTPAAVTAVKKPTRSASSDSTASTESSSSAAAPSTPTKSATTTATTADRSRYTPRESTVRETSTARTRGESVTATPVPEKKPFVSRFLPQHTHSTPEKKKAESESSTEEETSSEESEDEASKKPPVKAPVTPAATSSGASTYRERLEARRNSRDEANRPSSYVPNTSNYSSSSSTARSRPTPAAHHDTDSDRYGASGSRYGGSSYGGGSDLSRSRSSHALKSRDNSPDRSATAAANKDGEALSSWARYLKNKYGNKTVKDTRDAPSTSSHMPSSSGTSGTSSSSASRRLSLGLPLRQANEIASSDDDSKNGLGSPTSPTVAAGITGVAGTSPRQLYLRKRQQLFQLGGRGSEPGSFTWPRGLAVGPDNSIVVADSSNHRVQVFDSNGIFVKEFGEYGNGEGEFDCLAGVAVNRIGQYIIADRYNHRIQVLDPQGRFLRAFGSQGTADGKFNYPWGVTTDALGFIYVCDKENHRVQVFQSDGSFVGKFGSCGRGEGQLEHPHYIAVSNTNRVIVSDSNNHRIQIFDVNGKVLSTFGGEGSDDGQFKFPRGVAVDDQGYIFVADSGNNRIQIFNPDGSYLKAFGSWGSGDCEFKGLEGVAIMSNGNILVCDRENHRIQVF
ncbi:RING finger protein nhl-1 isoform X3 [Episyrphus balteatus]|uniref:RING finger protein nhl-1 isoform X3 n=1 Tax=Episyrphus balteatus TaxID=286459 RepID=UPI002486816F|nr:RING finger protein nhl-1 isoform X3 [Episyrphus balteatus]